MKLKYSLVPFEKAVTFQIIYQDKTLTNYVKETDTFVASNGWKVKVDAEPEIDILNKTIYLMGSDSSKDLKIDRTWNLASNYERDQIISAVHKALAELVADFKNRPLWKANKMPLFTTPNSGYSEVVIITTY